MNHILSNWHAEFIWLFLLPHIQHYFLWVIYTNFLVCSSNSYLMKPCSSPRISPCTAELKAWDSCSFISYSWHVFSQHFNHNDFHSHCLSLFLTLTFPYYMTHHEHVLWFIIIYFFIIENIIRPSWTRVLNPSHILHCMVEIVQMCSDYW